MRHRGEQHGREALEYAQQRNDHLTSTAVHAQKIAEDGHRTYYGCCIYYGYTDHGYTYYGVLTQKVSHCRSSSPPGVSRAWTVESMPYPKESTL